MIRVHLVQLVWALLLIGGATSNFHFKFDRDAGGYKDTWTSIDKLAHAGVCYMLADVGLGLHVPWIGVLVVIAVTGAIFEISQGYASVRDLVADVVGGIVACVVYLGLPVVLVSAR